MNLTVPQGLSLSPRFVFWKVGEQKAARSIRLLVPEGSGLKVISAKPKSSEIRAELKAVEGAGAGGMCCKAGQMGGAGPCDMGVRMPLPGGRGAMRRQLSGMRCRW